MAVQTNRGFAKGGRGKPLPYDARDTDESLRSAGHPHGRAESIRVCGRWRTWSGE